MNAIFPPLNMGLMDLSFQAIQNLYAQNMNLCYGVFCKCLGYFWVCLGGNRHIGFLKGVVKFREIRLKY